MGSVKIQPHCSDWSEQGGETENMKMIGQMCGKVAILKLCKIFFEFALIIGITLWKI